MPEANGRYVGDGTQIPPTTRAEMRPQTYDSPPRIPIERFLQILPASRPCSPTWRILASTITPMPMRRLIAGILIGFPVVHTLLDSLRKQQPTGEGDDWQDVTPPAGLDVGSFRMGLRKIAAKRLVVDAAAHIETAVNVQLVQRINRQYCHRDDRNTNSKDNDRLRYQDSTRLFTDIFEPDRRMAFDETLKQIHAALVVDDFEIDSAGSQMLLGPLKCPVFPDDNPTDSVQQDCATAHVARRQGGIEHRTPIVRCGAPARLLDAVHLGMQDRAALLYPTIVAAADDLPIDDEHRADGNATFGQPELGLCNRGFKKRIAHRLADPQQSGARRRSV